MHKIMTNFMLFAKKNITTFKALRSAKEFEAPCAEASNSSCGTSSIASQNEMNS